MHAVVPGFAKLVVPPRAVVLLCGLFSVLALTPAGASAETPQPLWTGCATNSGTDLQCGTPRGVAVAPGTASTRGTVYVADQLNKRVIQFTVWGDFVRAWGWDVVQSGPGNTGTGFEICVRADGDVCKGGSAGTGAGQFQGSSPQGVAVDSAGDVYVVDRGLPSNQRVQKFDPNGNFVLMWGKEVNETSGGNVCPRPGFPADVCKAGGIGAGPGEFGTFSVVGDYIEVDIQGTETTLDDEVCVGEVERIQCFGVNGVFLNEIELEAGETVRALAIDPAGSRYASFCGASCASGVAAKSNVVRKLSPGGEELDVVEVVNPQGLATDSTNALYALDGGSNPTIRKYSPAGAEVIEEENVFPFFPTYPFVAGLSSSTGIATGDGCLSAPSYNLYATNAAVAPNGFIHAYGPSPDEFHIEEFESCKPPEVPPVIENQGALSVGIEQAALQAKINPRFWADTSYHVQSATAKCVKEGGWEAECVEEKPVPDVLLGAGAVGAGTNTVPVLLSGLAPGTEYTFRFVAQSRFDAEGAEVNEKGGPVFGVGGTEEEDGAVGVFTTRTEPPGPITGCPNDAFRIGAAAFLPDCRAYEMVSPVEKGGDIRTVRLHDWIQVAPDGERITYTTKPTFAEQPSNKTYNQYLAERSVDGWINRGINLPLGDQLTNEAVIFPFREVSAFSPDLCSEWLADYNATPLTEDAIVGYANLYRQDLCGGEPPLEALTKVVPKPGGPILLYLNEADVQGVQGFSDDLGHVVFMARGGFTATSVEGDNKQLYDYEKASGELHLVSVLPDGSADPGFLKRGAEVGSGGGENSGSLEHAVSDDGSRIYWTSQIVSAVGQLYLRINPAEEQSALSGEECTEPAKACTVPVSGGEATFWTATPDGATALYSEGDLEAPVGSATLYRYSADTGESIPVVEGLKGILGASEDLSRIYYVSSKDLTPGQKNDEGDEAQEDEPNLYLDEEGSRTFVATLAADEAMGFSGTDGTYNIVSRIARFRASRVTPDGSRIVFESRAPLTGFDNVDAISGEPAVEVFTYEVGEGLHCISCDPNGERPRALPMAEAFRDPQGNSASDEIRTAAWIPGIEHQLHTSNVLSSDGNRIFFNAATPLVARDTNGAQDVYEWEAAGVGSCDEASPHYRELNGGCVYLVTSGKSPFESEFWDASEDGRDVFFTTEASLLPQDPGNIDLYDARAGGGIPQPVKEAECEGEACANPPAPPADSIPSSQTFEGPDNLTQGPDCRALARQAATLREQGKRQRSRAAARRLAAKAKAKGRAAKRCRHARRGAAR